jgi:YD repeat-containing protein
VSRAAQLDRSLAATMAGFPAQNQAGHLTHHQDAGRHPVKQTWDGLADVPQRLQAVATKDGKTLKGAANRISREASPSLAAWAWGRAPAAGEQASLQQCREPVA